MTKLQMAVDPLSMAEALKLAERVQDVVDILEVGTPMIVRDGLHPVTAIRNSWNVRTPARPARIS